MKKQTCNVLHNKLIRLSYFVIGRSGKKSVGVNFIDIETLAGMGGGNGIT